MNEQNKSDFWSGLGAGSYEAANQALMGLPDWLVKTAGGSENYKNLMKFKAENKMASDIGGGIGTVGSFFIPGGAVAKGLGLGAKALGAGKVAEGLGKAGAFLGGSGGKLGQQVLRSGGQALEQSAIRNTLDVTEDAQGKEKDLGQRLMNIGTETALGGALGGTLGAGLNKLTSGVKAASKAGLPLKQFITEDLADKGAGMGLAGAGFTKPEVQRAIRQSGIKLGKGERIEGEIQKLDKLAKKYEVTDSDLSKDALTKQYNDTWDFITAEADKVTSPKIMENLSKLAKDVPDLNKTSLMAMRTDLVDRIGALQRATDGPSLEKVARLREIKNKVDDEVIKLANVDPELIKRAKEMTPLAHLIDINRGRGALSDIGTGSESLGSNTQLKTSLEGLLSGKAGQAAGGGALGATLGATTSNDEDRLKNALIGGVGGAVGGAALQKLLGGSVGKVANAAKRGISEKLTPEVAENIGKAAEKGVELTEKAAPALTEAAAKAPAILADAQREGQALEAAAPDAVPGARLEVNSKFKATIDRALEDTYNRYYSDMTPDEFMANIKEVTNGLDPSNPKTAQIIAGFDPAGAAQYLKEYNTLLKVSTYTPDKGIGGTVAGMLGNNKQDNELTDALTDALAKDLGDIKSAGRKAKELVGLLKSGEVTLEQLKQYLLDSHLKTISGAGVTA